MLSNPVRGPIALSRVLCVTFPPIEVHQGMQDKQEIARRSNEGDTLETMTPYLVWSSDRYPIDGDTLLEMIVCDQLDITGLIVK